MRLLLIRHGEPDYSGDTLTDKGKREAELLSRRMEKYDIRDFYVSPLGRAQETAEYTLKRMGREAETLEWLQEFRARHLDPESGKMQICWDRKPRDWTAWPESYDVRRWTEIPIFQGSDTAEVWRETTEGIDALMARYGFRKDGPVWKCDENRAETIALFCHFGMEMAILGYLTDISPMILWHRFMCLPSAVTEVVTEERIRGEVSFRAVKIGDLTHLESQGEPRSTHGLYPEVYNGIDSTNPYINETPVRIY